MPSGDEDWDAATGDLDADGDTYASPDEGNDDDDDDDAAADEGDEGGGGPLAASTDLRVDLTFLAARERAVAAEAIGTARGLADLSMRHGYDARRAADVLHLFFENAARVMHEFLGDGFARRRNKVLTLAMCFRFIICVLVAGTYHEAYSNLAADKTAHGDSGNSFLRFPAELSNDDFAAIAAEIDEGRRDGRRPGSEDPFINKFRQTVTESFARLLSFIPGGDDLCLVLSGDDLQSTGRDGFRAGASNTYNKAKAVKYGLSFFTIFSLLVRLPLSIVQNTLDSKERGDTLAGIFIRDLLSKMSRYATHIAMSQVLADFDRGSLSMKNAFAAAGGLYVTTIKKPRARNRSNVPRSRSPAPATAPTCSASSLRTARRPSTTTRRGTFSSARRAPTNPFSSR